MSILVLAAFLTGTAPAFAQKQTPPEGTPPKPFTVPANETYTLPNGMKVTLVPYGIIPKAAISVAVDAGNVNEGKNRVGVADLTGELFKEGTVMLTAQELAQETGAMGSTLNVVVGADQSKLELDVLQEFAPQAVRLLADVVKHQRLPESGRGASPGRGRGGRSDGNARISGLGLYGVDWFRCYTDPT
jgi:hypothetical protein